MRNFIAIVFVFLFFNVSNVQAQDNPYLKGWEDSIVTEDTAEDYFMCVHGVFYFSYHLFGSYDKEKVLEICHEFAQAFFKNLYEDYEVNDFNTVIVEKAFMQNLENILKSLKPAIENDFIINN